MDHMNRICPIVTGTQETLLLVVVELATTKVFIQRAFSLLGMRLDQNPIVDKFRMVGCDQQ